MMRPHIIAFRTSVEGVLLACCELLQHPGSDLMFAESIDEVKSKLSFIGAEHGIDLVGFTSGANIKALVLSLFGQRRTKISRWDPDIEDYIDLVLRHSSCDPAELVRFMCSCAGNADMLYSCKGRQGSRSYTLMKEVARAYRQLCMFARPEPVNGVLLVKIGTGHRIGDMFCRWLAAKNHDMPVAVVDNRTAWIGNGRYLGLEDLTHMPSTNFENIGHTEEKGSVEELWDVYFDSQMIQGRRNRKHAMRVQTSTSSDISDMSARDRYKAERGIHKYTLDQFSGAMVLGSDS